MIPKAFDRFDIHPPSAKSLSNNTKKTKPDYHLGTSADTCEHPNYSANDDFLRAHEGVAFIKL